MAFISHKFDPTWIVHDPSKIVSDSRLLSICSMKIHAYIHLASKLEKTNRFLTLGHTFFFQSPQRTHKRDRQTLSLGLRIWIRRSCNTRRSPSMHKICCYHRGCAFCLEVRLWLQGFIFWVVRVQESVSPVQVQFVAKCVLRHLVRNHKPCLCLQKENHQPNNRPTNPS